MPAARKSQTSAAPKSAEAKPKARRASRSQSKSPSRQAKPRSRSASRSRGQKQQEQPKKAANKGRASTPTRKQPAARSRSASRDRTAKNLPKESTPTRVSKRATKSANNSVNESKTTTTKVTSTRSSRNEKLESSTTSNASRRSESPVKRVERKSKNYEFGGPWGVSVLILLLPAVLLYANLQCDKRCDPRSFRIPMPRLSSLFSIKSLIIFASWLLFQSVLYCLPIGGAWIRGLPLRSGGARLQYHCNGFFSLIVSLVIIGCVEYSGRLQLSRLVADQFIQLTATSIAFSAIASALLFARAYRLPSGKCSQQGISGCWAYDFFMGRELNPRIGWFDLKFFCELRPGIIGWAAMEALLCYRAYAMGQLTPSLSLLTAFHLIYVADSLYFEQSILSTVDIVQEGFGFMLAFGDLAWVPFGYTITSRYLFATGYSLPWYCLIGIAALNATGYIIFRVSNSQKDTFRQQPQHPSLVGMRSVPTGTIGGGLLADGLWGKVRHPNYIGDLLMALSWSLLAGIKSPMPWLYFLNLLFLLLHRITRVESHCRNKYSVAWNRYVEMVPYRLIPRIF